MAGRIKWSIRRSLTRGRELLDGHRWHSNTLRPVGHLRLGELGSGGAPFTLELLLSNSLLSCGLLLLLNLHQIFIR